MKVDLHGYPIDIIETGFLDTIVQQSWEMGELEIFLIHGHGRNRGMTVPFKTNTGMLGITVRRALRQDSDLRQWIKRTTLDCTDPGVTSVELKHNPNPSRTALDSDLLKPPHSLHGRRQQFAGD
jgi:hypothetical protein